MQAILESRGDAEVAAASAEGPQQLGVLVGARVYDRPVGRDELCPDQVVARQPVLSGQVADAAAEGEARDAGRADDAARRHESEGLGRRVEVDHVAPPSALAIRPLPSTSTLRMSDRSI